MIHTSARVHLLAASCDAIRLPSFVRRGRSLSSKSSTLVKHILVASSLWDSDTLNVLSGPDVALRVVVSRSAPLPKLPM